VKDRFVDARQPVPFGQRRAAPRVCVVDSKPHIRTFLAEALEELGFVPYQCARVSDIAAALSSVTPDLIVLGLLVPESGVAEVMRALAAERYEGKVMLFGGRASLTLLGLHDLGENLGLTMLPPLRTPFRGGDLQENLAVFLPIPPSPSLPVDVEAAVRNGTLELWYQPEIDLQQMSIRTAEALVRLRDPAWGVVAPASLIPSDDDPHFRVLSDFVLGRALADWNFLAAGRAPIEIAVNLPLAALADEEGIERVVLQLPDHSAFARLMVEISSTDVGRDPALARKVAKQLDAYNVGLSIDDVMAELSWADVEDFPIAELKVDQRFIEGCANDRHKRSVCATILKIAARLKARTVAKGIETTADFQAVCDMGFDLGQGDLLAKPMDARKLARTMLPRRAEPAR
jgi:EAL domain-containing protein (putative c-di-GMP-specific phosphodiesterase class I)